MGYPESNFTSLHQPGGVKKNWPAGQTSYRTMLDLTKNKPNKFKVKLWIPPGTKETTLITHVEQGNNFSNFFIARLGKPPESTVFTPSAVSNGFKLSALSAKDCHGVGVAGYIQIVNDMLPNVTTGHWRHGPGRRVGGSSGSFR